MCTLRAGGDRFDVDAFLDDSTFCARSVYHAGDPRPKGFWDGAGFTVGVSDREWSDLPGQVADAIAFLERHAGELRRLAAFPGVEAVDLEFPRELRIGGGVVVQSDRFPKELVKLAGELGVGLELCLYPKDEGPAGDE